MGVTALSTLTARQARADEFDVVMELLAESIRWLRSKGLDQWSTWHQWREKMAPSLACGDVWLLCDGGDLVGTVTVELHGDPDFWTPAELAEPAAYVSKLAVRRDRAGAELGALLLEWAGDYAYRRGCRWMRLDAWKTNTQLHAYYRSRGWTYLRTSPNPRRRSGALFQSQARPLSAEGRHRIGEVPPMPTLQTSMWTQEGADAAGNWQPGHTHAGGFTVDYPSVGERPALFAPCMRYRVREQAGAWLLEASPAGAPWWERHGVITRADVPLTPGRTYVITHQEGEHCAMAIAETPAPLA